MQLLRKGMRSQEVKNLQERLRDLGFFEHEPTGFFGEITEEAVKKFQKSKNLEVDGIVGPNTWKMLFSKEIELSQKQNIYNTDVSITTTNEESFSLTPEDIKQLLPNSPLENIKKYWPEIANALKKYNLWYKDMILMALGTIYAETSAFKPIDEYISKYNTPPGGEPYSKYDFRTDIGNNAVGDGSKYKGRGFIQLTGKSNYRAFGKKLGIDLISNPELANDPKYAAEILALFLKDKESKIKRALLEQDLRTARKLVNGGTHGLDQFVEVFDNAIESGLV